MGHPPLRFRAQETLLWELQATPERGQTAPILPSGIPRVLDWCTAWPEVFSGEVSVSRSVPGLPRAL